MSTSTATRDSKSDAPVVDGALVAARADFKLDPARSYTAQVHDALQQAILRGVLHPRTALSEATISSLIAVSRTPVREALAQLAEEQLVLIYRQVGALVAPVRMSLLEEGRFVAACLDHAGADQAPVRRVRWLLLGHVAGHADRALQEHEKVLAQMAARDVAGLGAGVAGHINHITEHLAALRQQAPASYFAD